MDEQPPQTSGTLINKISHEFAEKGTHIFPQTENKHAVTHIAEHRTCDSTRKLVDQTRQLLL